MWSVSLRKLQFFSFNLDEGQNWMDLLIKRKKSICIFEMKQKSRNNVISSMLISTHGCEQCIEMTRKSQRNWRRKWKWRNLLCTLWGWRVEWTKEWNRKPLHGYSTYVCSAPIYLKSQAIRWYKKDWALLWLNVAKWNNFTVGSRSFVMYLHCSIEITKHHQPTSNCFM